MICAYENEFLTGNRWSWLPSQIRVDQGMS